MGRGGTWVEEDTLVMEMGIAEVVTGEAIGAMMDLEVMVATIMVVLVQIVEEAMVAVDQEMETKEAEEGEMILPADP